MALLALLAVGAGTGWAQQTAGNGAPTSASKETSGDTSGASAGAGRILLVLPFDNLTPAGHEGGQGGGQAGGRAETPGNLEPGKLEPAKLEPANLDWLGEAIPEILDSRFTSAGFLPLGRDDRLYALDHLGLPETFEPSRAMALRIAQTLDASYMLFGSFTLDSSTLTLKARIVDVAQLRLSEELTQSFEMAQFIPEVNSLAWRLTRQLDPSFGVAEETFRAAGAKLRLDAFEQYIRGLTEHDPAERLRHLKKATELSPDFTEAWLATGKLQFAGQEYEQAAVSFSKVTRPASGTDPEELEASFYRGLSLMFSGNYPRAEEAFASVARVLPLPEVVNNEAVAMSRRGRDASALFRQAEAADSTDPDYRFNLAVSLNRHGDKAEALAELAQCLKLRPADSEARATEAAWQAATLRNESKDAGRDASKDAGKDASLGQAAVAEPLERIKRTYDGAAFRQASLMLEEVENGRLAALPAAERAGKLAASARDKLNHGLLLEAERGYQAALQADDHSAEAHAGLAEVRERAGDMDAARKEAQAALDRQPNLEAYLVLARLDLSQNRLPEARVEAGEAVKLDSSNRAARDLRKTIDARIEARPAAEEAPTGAAKP